MNMNTNQKNQEQLNRGIAIAVAILLALTLIVTVIAFSASKHEGTKPAITTSRTLSTLATGATKGSTTKTQSTTSTTSTSSTSSSTSTTEPGKTPGNDDKPTVVLTPDFVCPLGGTLVKDYSADIPVFSITMEDYRVHCGIDIGADAGTEVLAAADGEITKVFYDPMMGQTVEITHEGGFVTIYKNLQTKMPASICAGMSVSAGDTIGYVGDTALIEISDSPHLHFEMRKDGESINPLSHFEIPENAPSSDYED